jgi:N utilization substance protein A
LSLAIGKKGQNVRLASKLIGWRIDIKSEEEKRAEIESQIDRMREIIPTPLADLAGLTPSLMQKLTEAGIGTVEELANLSPEDLEKIPGIGGKTVERISDAITEFYAQMPSYQDEMERATAERLFAKDDPVPEESSEEKSEEPAQQE